MQNGGTFVLTSEVKGAWVFETSFSGVYAWRGEGGKGWVALDVASEV